MVEESLASHGHSTLNESLRYYRHIPQAAYSHLETLNRLDDPLNASEYMEAPIVPGTESHQPTEQHG